MKSFIQTAKAFLYKKEFDWDREITFQNFHPQMQLFLAINGIFFNNRESKIRFIFPVLSTLITLVAVGFEVLFIWHGISIEDYGFATECFCYFFILGAVGIVYSSVLLNREKLFKLVYNMNSDFLFICNLKSEYRNRFLSGQLLIWRLCWSWIVFLTFIAILYICNTLVYLLYQSTLATPDEHTVRPLIFPMWLPEDDPYRTPNYEVFLALEIILISVVIITFGFYVYILFHLLLHSYNLMDIIMMALDELFSGLDASVAALPRGHPRREAAQAVLNDRMQRIVRWHISVFESVDDISSVFGPTLVYQVMFSSIVICLVAYQIAERNLLPRTLRLWNELPAEVFPRDYSMGFFKKGVYKFLRVGNAPVTPLELQASIATRLSEGKFDYLFGVLGVGACLQLWIPCYIGTLLRNKGFYVGDCCFNCGWHETPLSQLLRHDLVIFIQRTQRPVAIKFTGLPHLQLETFSSIMSNAYSLFNMLRQYN